MITSTNGCKHQNQHKHTNSNTQNDYQKIILVTPNSVNLHQIIKKNQNDYKYQW